MRLPLLSAALFLSLAACSGAPGDADIKAALEKSLNESQSPLKAVGIDIGVKIVSAKQIGCTKDKEGAAYICDVQLSVASKNLFTGKEETSDGTEKIRLVKTDKGWVVSK